MRIRRLTVKNFGKFENYAVDFNGNLAVINGQNEAGKSTIFDMIKVLLFGLDEDASPEERMGYVRYGANEAHISGEFERADGSPLTLSRIISQHSCDLNVNENFVFQNLGNVKAQIVSDISKEVYENIYALDFHAMSAIKDDIWQGIREEFMDADMAKELVSANDAIEISKTRADSLYKSANAPSAIGELLKERDSLKEKLADINQSHKLAGEDYLNLDKTKREITDKQNKIEFEGAFIAEANKMNGLKNDVSRIKTLAGEAGDLSPYKQWLPNIKEEYAALKQLTEDAKIELEQVENNIPQEEAIAEPEMPEKHQKALEYENEIRALRIVEDTEPVIGEKQESDGEDEYIKANEEWSLLSDRVVNEEISQDEIFKSIDQINSMSLAEKLEIYIKSKEDLNDFIKDNSQPKRSGSRNFFFVITLILSILMVLSGAALIAEHFFSTQIGELLSKIASIQQGFYDFLDFFKIIPLSDLITADLLCGIGLILLVVAFAFIKTKSPISQIRNTEEKVKKAREESELNRIEFEKQLFGLPIARIRIKRAEATIAEDIIRLKEARQKLFEAKKYYEEHQSNTEDQTIKNTQSEEQDGEIAKLTQLLLGFSRASSSENLNALNDLLDEALQYKAKEYVPETEDAPVTPAFEAAAVDVSEIEKKYLKAKKDLAEFESLLGQNPESEIENIQERYNKLNRAVVLRDEILEKYPNFKEISERLNQLSKAGWPYTEDAVSKANERIDELRDQIGKEQNKIGVMENSVKKAILGHDPADIASQILKLDDKIINYKMEYDKLRLSEHIIKEGHDTFSKLHQPEVLQRASYYLSILTEGKYSELDLDSETSEITVLTQTGKFMTPQAARLSQATREQIYLSIRLSVIESFDDEREVMPVTLDEALITWDKDRLTAGLDLLAQIAHKRQILIFTCHDLIVDTMKENQPTAQIIELK